MGILAELALFVAILCVCLWVIPITHGYISYTGMYYMWSNVSRRTICGPPVELYMGQ